MRVALVAGVNPCPQGWVAVYMPAIGGLPSTIFQESFQILCDMPFRVIVVNIPIGLPDAVVSGGRLADRDARILLERCNGMLYSAPPRRALQAASYSEAYRLALENSVDGTSIARGLYQHIVRIREVDDCMTPALQQRIFESHGELSFCIMAGCPLQHPPSEPWAAAERSKLLQRQHFPRLFVECAHFDLSHVPEHDFLAACAACWTARRVLQKKSRVLPEGKPILDARGLRMEKHA